MTELEHENQGLSTTLETLQCNNQELSASLAELQYEYELTMNQGNAAYATAGKADRKCAEFEAENVRLRCTLLHLRQQNFEILQELHGYRLMQGPPMMAMVSRPPVIVQDESYQPQDSTSSFEVARAESVPQQALVVEAAQSERVPQQDLVVEAAQSESVPQQDLVVEAAQSESVPQQDLVVEAAQSESVSQQDLVVEAAQSKSVPQQALHEFQPTSTPAVLNNRGKREARKHARTAEELKVQRYMYAELEKQKLREEQRRQEHIMQSWSRLSSDALHFDHSDMLACLRTPDFTCYKTDVQFILAQWGNVIKALKKANKPPVSAEVYEFQAKKQRVLQLWNQVYKFLQSAMYVKNRRVMDEYLEQYMVKKQKSPQIVKTWGKLFCLMGKRESQNRKFVAFFIVEQKKELAFTRVIQSFKPEPPPYSVSAHAVLTLKDTVEYRLLEIFGGLVKLRTAASGKSQLACTIPQPTGSKEVLTEPMPLACVGVCLDSKFIQNAYSKYYQPIVLRSRQKNLASDHAKAFIRDVSHLYLDVKDFYPKKAIVVSMLPQSAGNVDTFGQSKLSLRLGKKSNPIICPIPTFLEWHLRGYLLERIKESRDRSKESAFAAVMELDELLANSEFGKDKF